VADIFSEVDEEVRREKLKTLWDRYQTLIIGLILLVVIAVAGWRGYQWWEAKQATKFGTAFEQAIALGEAGKHAEAEAAYAKIDKDGTPAYRDLARLRHAAELATHDAKAAVADYKQIAADNAVEPVLRNLATLRAGATQINERAFDDARTLLEPMAAPGQTFRHSARELLALAAWRAGDAAALKRWIGVIVRDPETPAATRSRVEVLVALSAAMAKS
jgi:hypothetical protein